MTKSQFIALCVERTIEPSLALENDQVLHAIKLGNIDLLITVLNNQF
jgi:hypothetical protein